MFNRYKGLLKQLVQRLLRYSHLCSSILWPSKNSFRNIELKFCVFYYNYHIHIKPNLKFLFEKLKIPLFNHLIKLIDL